MSAEGASSPRADLLLLGAQQLLTCHPSSGVDGPARGAAQAEIGLQPAGSGLAIRDGRILEIAESSALLARYPEASVYDAGGQVLLPGFVDCHTHLLFAGNRAGEWERVMAGESYLNILKGGGGIQTTVRATLAASRESLLEHGEFWLKRMLELGTTQLEAKSGYRLDEPGELELLSLHRELAARGPIGITSTYLGAHVVPLAYRERREEYLALVERVIERAAAEQLCEFVDVFCEREAFSLEETRRLLSHAKSLGLGLKLHTEQFTASGGTSLGVELSATSVDHLEVASEADIQALAAADSPPICVLLPGVAFHMNLSTHAPGRALVDAGVPVAIATDFNPGSSPTPSMPFMVALAARTQGLSIPEAILAATYNAACALNLEAEMGSLARGKLANIACLDIPDYRYLAYSFGYNPVKQVFVRGAAQLPYAEKRCARAPS